MVPHRLLPFLVVAAVSFAAGCGSPQGTVITFPASAVGKEADVLNRQIERFHTEHPEVRVVFQKVPDASDQRHQLYVQWLNAGASDPDILQLDVIWTAEFAAAGWVLPLELDTREQGDFFPATLDANRWDGKLYALPWFVDVGVLYYRKDLIGEPPTTFAEVEEKARTALSAQVPHGFVWQGARYEGLVCVFVEYLGGSGGKILDEKGNVVVDSEEAVRALTRMREEIYAAGVVPEDTLTWREEQTRFRFQNGQAVFLRNWPYAYPLMQDSSRSKVAGKFAVTVMPRGPGGRPTATLGGSMLAINKNTEHPDAARKVLEFLTRPEQMRQRAEVVGQFPPRRSLYDDRLYGDLPAEQRAQRIAPEKMAQIIEQATPRPVTPVYTELSEILQIALHEALTRQKEPQQALAEAAQQMRAVLVRAGLKE
jgi:multiple sugar transport system substrate-binding protein